MYHNTAHSEICKSMLVYIQDQALSLVTTVNYEINFNIPVKGLKVVSKGTETYHQVPIYI